MNAVAVSRSTSVADAVGEALAATGVRHAFGVLGSGNLVVTNALCGRGAKFHHARHEGSAICMADGYSRVSGEVGICSVHQGPGLTNTVTGLTEAVKSRTPILVLAGESPLAALNSNFRIDQPGLAESVGAGWERIGGAGTAASDALRAYERARRERRPIVLNLPIDIQPQAAVEGAQAAVHAGAAGASTAGAGGAAGASTAGAGAAAGASTAGADAGANGSGHAELPESAPSEIAAVADLLQSAQRPVIIAGRGAVLADAREELERLGALIGALLVTSAPANGLFAGLPFALGISGGFASPFAARLLPQADVVLVAGASVNHWTTRHGQLISPDAKVAQIDVETDAFGRHRPTDHPIHGDANACARALADELERRGHRATGWRTDELRKEITASTWRDDPYDDGTTDEWIDPRTLSIALEALLPADKAVAVDSGHFLGWPAMFLSVPDARAWVFPNGFQAVGLGLGNAIGAAIARPERPTVAAIGDGGAFMALAEIETAVREQLKLLLLIYDDCAYGAEVHHFAPMGHDVHRVRFPDADLAAIARAAGAEAITVRRATDLGAVTDWLAEPRPRPLVLDAKVNPTICAEWLSEAFRGG